MIKDANDFYEKIVSDMKGLNKKIQDKHKRDYDFLLLSASLFENYTNKIGVMKYIKSHSLEQMNKAYTEYKTLNFNQKQLFFNSVLYNSKQVVVPLKSLHTMERELWRIKKGMLNRNLIINTKSSFCGATILGFIRALKADTAFVVNVKIDGKRRKMLVKSFMGLTDDKKFNRGVNHLLLDPKTYDIYNLAGLPVYYSLKEVSKLDLKNYKTTLNLKQNRNFFKYKHLLDYEVKDFYKRHAKRTTFNKRHGLLKRLIPKKKLLFSGINKKSKKK